VTYRIALRHKNRTTVQVDKESRSKARRLAKLRTSVEDMRSKLRRDLRSSDPNRFLTALAVGILDETNENPITAKRKHVRFGDEDAPSAATMRFNRQGKSRLKRVASPHIVQALNNAYEAIEDDDEDLFKHDLGHVTAEHVNDYLAKFGLKEADLRGFNANRELQERLARVRAAGKALPKNGRARQKVLRAEFAKTLDEVADLVGHDSATIRGKYLMPGLEASYLKDGSFGVKEASESSALLSRIVLRTLY